VLGGEPQKPIIATSSSSLYLPRCSVAARKTSLSTASWSSAREESGLLKLATSPSTRVPLPGVALCIVDLDLHHMEWQLEHPVIGRSGFGMSTLLFELPAGAGLLPACGGPYANSAFSEFVMALRAHRLHHGVAPTFIPFVQPGLYATAQRVLSGQALAPNRYDTWGHCFGSDPWIGLIEAAAADGPGVPSRILAGAFGFNGYYTVSAVDLDAGLRTEFRHVEPHMFNSRI